MIIKSPTILSRNFYSAAILMIAAIFFGGGGSPSPGAELVLELVAAAIAVVSLCKRGPIGGSIGVYLLCSMVLLVPFSQLFFSLAAWGLSVEPTYDLFDVLPHTVSISSTLAAALSLVPPLLLFILTSRLCQGEKYYLVCVLLAVIALISVLGICQVIFPNVEELRFYSDAHGRVAIGPFANRNHFADMLLIGIIGGVACFPREWVGRSRSLALALTGVLVGVLALTVVATASRAGLLLLCLVMSVIAASLVIKFFYTSTASDVRVGPTDHLGRRPWIVLLGVAGAIALGGAVLNSMVFQRLFARFSDLEDVRPELWEDTVRAIHLTAPAGSGMGTFVPIFQSVERLSIVSPYFANRAHQEYLELGLEAGIYALFVALGVLVWLAGRVKDVIRSGDPRRRQMTVFSLGGMSIVALHSWLDYPLRTLAISCIVGMMFGLVAGTSERRLEILPGQLSDKF